MIAGAAGIFRGLFQGDKSLNENWVILAKRADFDAIGRHFGIDPVIARVMRNRDMTEIPEMEMYLNGTKDDLYDPHLLKDADKAAGIIRGKIGQQKKIRIIGDYDMDGVMSTYILLKALRRLGADVDYVIPERIRDGYGLNEHLVRQAAEDGVDTILTCDNGIAAVEQIRLAKDLGMTVIVTDHHEIRHEPVPREGDAGQKNAPDEDIREILPDADATVNPKQNACSYPFDGLCGSAVAFKLVQVLYEQEGIDPSYADEFLEFAGFATVGDVMDLIGENRILAKLGIDMLRRTKNTGMQALIREKNVQKDRIGTYQIGFVLGPCLNASGRLETAQYSLNLLLSDDPEKADAMARELSELNETRKKMTDQAVKQAMDLVRDKGYDRDLVMVIFLPDCHESLAGLVAGRLREFYHRPVFVVTRGEENCKGSARSTEEYSMYEEMCRCSDLFTQFGGHPMAAGFSIKEENIDALRTRLNELTTLTEEDLIPKVLIDADMPIDYINMDLVRQLDLLEPCGKGNRRPLFADRNLEIVSLRVGGKSKPVTRMKLKSSRGRIIDAVYFGDIENLRSALEQKYDGIVAKDTISGRCTHHASLHFTYHPEINNFLNEEKIELKITGMKA